MADLIDRQKAIDEILRLTHYDTVRSLYEATVANKYEDCYEDGIIDAIDVIVGLTSPQPERKTGEWQYVDYGGFGNWHCTACRKICICNGDFDYCPNCGAKMEEEAQEHGTTD